MSGLEPHTHVQPQQQKQPEQLQLILSLIFCLTIVANAVEFAS